MKTFALATGSSGNCIYVESGEFRALVDCGLSFSKSKEILEEKGVDINLINHIFITHEHSDHVAGLKQFVKNLDKCKFYLSQGTLDNLEIEYNKFNIVKNHDLIQIDNVRILVVNKPHDAKEAISFVFEGENKKLGIFTDLGHVPNELIHLMQNLDLIYLECNYSQEYIKENCSHMSHHYLNRLMSNVGHLGLHQCVDAIESFVKTGQIIVLSHISENTISYEEASSKVFEKIIDLEVDVELEISFQGESTQIFNLDNLKKIEQQTFLEEKITQEIII